MKITKSAVCRFSVSLLAIAGLAAAQDQTPHAWRSVNDPLPAAIDPAPDPSAPPANISAQPDPAQSNAGQYSSGQYSQQAAQPDPGQYSQAPNQAPYPPYNGPAPAGQQNYPPPANYSVPPRLTIKNGTYVTVRMNQWLSSDRNKQGDTFTATLDQPLVVDGFVVAQRGQTVYGRVTQAEKAGRVEGTSKLGVELTQLTLVDGDQASIQSQMINRNGPTSNGRDAAAIGGTTAVGAAIGAGVNGGVGAGVGAGAGAVVGIIGVLLTRGRPTVIYPESVMTFQVQAPVEVATDKATQAFQYVNAQQDYGRGYGYGPATAYGPAGQPGYAPATVPAYGYGYPGYYGPYAYGYPYPYYGGFGVGVIVGRGYYGRSYYGGGFRGGFRR